MPQWMTHSRGRLGTIKVWCTVSIVHLLQPHLFVDVNQWDCLWRRGKRKGFHSLADALVIIDRLHLNCSRVESISSEEVFIVLAEQSYVLGRAFRETPKWQKPFPLLSGREWDGHMELLSGHKTIYTCVGNKCYINCMPSTSKRQTSDFIEILSNPSIQLSVLREANAFYCN